MPVTSRAWLVLLLAASLILRLAWTMLQPVDERPLASLPDQREYLELGRNLLHGDGLHFYDERFGDNVWAYRTPGYPLLIAVCGGNVRAVRIVQAAIDT